MTVKCPHCGLEGKAEEEILHKKIRCPKCKKIFIAERAVGDSLVEGLVPREDEGMNLSEEVVVEQANVGASFTVPVVETITEPACSTELGETIEDGDIALLDDEDAAADEILPDGVFRCVRCGFVFSEQYRQDSVDGPFCFACNVTAEQQPAAS